MNNLYSVDIESNLHFVDKHPLTWQGWDEKNKKYKDEKIVTTRLNQALILTFLNNEFLTWKIVHVCYSTEHPLIMKIDTTVKGVVLITVAIQWKGGRQTKSHVVLCMGTIRDTDISMLEIRHVKTKYTNLPYATDRS